ncbi:hypothetical protein EAI_17231 [Harpegnathos saltator]|uniref:Uncharacterized protein n=1 Tax=Harpegnathos saltator TaxID=610380 RepID=E2BQL6_HARSA|nr:hypothetical protein EAI_17231 [Harpegnathos saltator]
MSQTTIFKSLPKTMKNQEILYILSIRKMHAEAMPARPMRPLRTCQLSRRPCGPRGPVRSYSGTLKGLVSRTSGGKPLPLRPERSCGVPKRDPRKIWSQDLGRETGLTSAATVMPNWSPYGSGTSVVKESGVARYRHESRSPLH